MELCPYESNKPNEPFLTVVFLFMIATRNRFMNVYPLGRKSTIEEMFPSDGGLLVDEASKVFGKFAWINWWGRPVLKTQ